MAFRKSTVELEDFSIERETLKAQVLELENKSPAGLEKFYGNRSDEDRDLSNCNCLGNLVFYLLTTGLEGDGGSLQTCCKEAHNKYSSRDDELLKLGAYMIDQERTYSFLRYIMPENRILNADVSEISGFSVQGDTLLHFGREVDHKTTEEALGEFLSFLETLPKPITVADNDKDGSHILRSAIKKYGMAESFKNVLPNFMELED